ncbi:MAG TPA: hypothetical protein VEX38_03720 [Fimbriimonadaceae bacterium]|nr:hypothetical protein [Fimbriimonadaceae bacterium]
MRYSGVFTTFVCLSMLLGCQSQQQASTSGPASGSKSGSPSSTKAAPGGETGQVVPDELKHEGYQYFGIGGKSLQLEMVNSANKTTSSGSQMFELEGVKDGEAKFTQTWTGGLNALGSSVVAVRKDGVYTIENAGREVKPPQLELPADPKPGFSWSGSSSFYLPDQTKVDQQTKLTIVSTERVKTKGGEFDALKVKVTGTLNYGGKKNPVDMTYWYVKEVGPVRVEFSSVVKNKPAKVTIQAVK